jgi:luciferase family oxidoreductase group 1
MTTFALQRDRRTASPDDFPEQLAELLAHYDGGFPDNHPFARLGRSLPGAPHQPEIWLLGSSAQSALWAGQLGLPYALADFINPEGAANAELYRERFEPSARSSSQRTAVAVWAICAETDEEAERLAASGRMTFTLLRQGRLIAVPPPEKAQRFIASTEGVARRGVIGSPETVRAGIETIASAYGAEEVIVVTITYDHGARRRSYELIADAFGVEPPAEAAVHAG